jgi:hypothetical protein
MKVEEIIDYALPCMLAEKELKEAHQLMLQNKYQEAMESGVKAIDHIHHMLYAIENRLEP